MMQGISTIEFLFMGFTTIMLVFIAATLRAILENIEQINKNTRKKEVVEMRDFP